MKKRKNKKFIVIFIILLVFLVILGFIIFKIHNYKNAQMGNTIANKTLQEVENYILNISSYEAEIEVKVESNKNTNKYIINQKYNNSNVSSQEVIEPKNIEGLTVKYDGANLEITNSKLNLTTIYENYQYIADNVLWLSDFIQNYKENNGTISEENGIIIMETNCNNNKYYTHEKLYIDRTTSKITKMIIEDENHNSKIYITYNRIEIGGLSKENVLALERVYVIKKEI